MFGESIHRLRRKKKIGQQEIAEHIGVSKSLVSMWERNTRTPAAEQVEALEKFLGGKLSQRGGGDMLREGVTIPIRGKVWASPFRLASPTNSIKSVRALLGESDCFALEVEGESMKPTYNHGDIIICKPRNEVLSPFCGDEEGGYVPITKYHHLHNRDCVVTLNGETSLKRIILTPKKGQAWEMSLVSLNDSFPTVVIKYGDEFKCEAVVVRNVLPELPE